MAQYYQDADGTVYEIGPDGKKKAISTGAGQKQPSLADIAKDTVQDIAKDKIKKEIKNQIVGNTASAAAPSLANVAPVGTAANGGALMSDGTIAADITPVGSAANGGVMMSDGSIAGGSTTAASGGTPNFSIGSPSYAGYIGAGIGAYNGIKNFDNRPSDQKATYAQQQAALAVANIYTGGLAGLAEGFARKQWGGTMAKLDKLDQKYNPITRLANHFEIFGGNRTGKAKEANTAALAAIAPEDKQYQDYVSAMRQGFDAPPPDPSKPFHGGQYGSWDEYKAAGLDAKDLTGVYGNISTFGPDWAKYTQDQREGITQALINGGLYDSQKGDVVVTDAEAAKKLRDEYLKNYKAPTGSASLAGLDAQTASQNKAARDKAAADAKQQTRSASLQSIMNMGGSRAPINTNYNINLDNPYLR